MAGTTISGLTHPVLENDYASEWMGIEVLSLDDGHATIRMTLRQEMLNGFGMAHGGMIFAFADSAFALACNPATPAPSSAGTPANTAGTAGAAADSITVASGVDINFLKPAFQGQVITAVADRRSSRAAADCTTSRSSPPIPAPHCRASSLPSSAGAAAPSPRRGLAMTLHATEPNAASSTAAVSATDAVLDPEETMSRDQIEALQLGRLQHTVAYAYDRVPLYKRKFDDAGIHPTDLRELSDLGNFPFTTKEDLRQEYPFGMFAVPQSEVARVHASSGTTGRPTVVGYTEKDLAHWAKLVARCLRASGVRPGMKVHNA